MEQSLRSPRIVRFDVFEVDLGSGELRRHLSLPEFVDDLLYGMLLPGHPGLRALLGRVAQLHKQGGVIDEEPKG